MLSSRLMRDQGQGRMILSGDEAWLDALRWDDVLKRPAPGRCPSIGQLVTDIGEGALQVNCGRDARKRSRAGGIRAQIDLVPEAKDAHIAQLLGTTPLRVLQERRRYARRTSSGPGDEL